MLLWMSFLYLGLAHPLSLGLALCMAQPIIYHGQNFYFEEHILYSSQALFVIVFSLFKVETTILSFRFHTNLTNKILFLSNFAKVAP